MELRQPVVIVHRAMEDGNGYKHRRISVDGQVSTYYSLETIGTTYYVRYNNSKIDGSKDGYSCGYLTQAEALAHAVNAIIRDREIDANCGA